MKTERINAQSRQRWLLGSIAALLATLVVAVYAATGTPVAGSVTNNASGTKITDPTLGAAASSLVSSMIASAQPAAGTTPTAPASPVPSTATPVATPVAVTAAPPVPANSATHPPTVVAVPAATQLVATTIAKEVEPAKANVAGPAKAADVTATPTATDLALGAVLVTTGAEKTISLVLDDVPLSDVVKLFTHVAGANIIANTSNLTGQVTANLQEVPWRPALESILERQGLQLIEKPPASSIYVIETRKAGEDPRVSQTITLNYEKADDITKLMQGIMASNGTVTAFPAANAIVITSTELHIAELRKIIDGVDRPRPQVYIEARFVQVDDGGSKNLGIDWQMLNNYQINATVSADTSFSKSRSPGNNSVGSTTTHEYDMYGNEMPPLNSYQTVNGVSVPMYDPVTKTFNNRETDITSARGFNAVLNPGALNVVLSMLEQANGAKLINDPKIIVANEQTAIIKVANDEPNIKLTVTRATVQGQADLITSELDGTRPFFTYGITMTITPRINLVSSNITISIKPELSRKLSDKTAPDGNTFPVISKNAVETVFTLADGHTAAIGGLTTVSDTITKSKVPVLGDIPYLGSRLFSYSSHVTSTSEVLIFVTVGLVDPRSATENVFNPRYTPLIRKSLEEEDAGRDIEVDKKVR
jgi:type II secretory pathway component GspD/PulD (secretin)